MQNVKGIDLFIDGHSHTVMTASKDNNMVQSTGTGLAYVGAIVIDNATKSIESNGLIDLSAYTKEDATVKAAADKIISDINAEYGKVFARTDVELNGAKEPGNRTQETNLGDLITDSMLWAIRKDAELTVPAENVVAITNGGGIPGLDPQGRHLQAGREHRAALRQHRGRGVRHRRRAAGGPGGFYLCSARLPGRLPPDRRHEHLH